VAIAPGLEVDVSAALTQKEREQTADFDPVDEAGQEPGCAALAGE